MSEELFCPNCGHDVGEHGDTGCTHMHGVNLWCRCKFSASGIHLNWLKHEYMNLREQLDVTLAGLKWIKELFIENGEYNEATEKVDEIFAEVERIGGKNE